MVFKELHAGTKNKLHYYRMYKKIGLDSWHQMFSGSCASTKELFLRNQEQHLASIKGPLKM